MTDPLMPVAVHDERPALVSVGTPTQIANPTRTTLRTLVQVVIPALVIGVPVLNTVLAQTSDYLASQDAVPIPAWVYLVLNGTLAIIVLVTGLVARLMANPVVAAFVARVLPGLAPIRPGR
jgi:hypothetical protein